MCKLAASGISIKDSRIVELGPGDSLGIGIMAILCGAREFTAVDVKRHASQAVNSELVRVLASFLRERRPIPNDNEVKGIYPRLENYDFPKTLLTSTHIATATSQENIDRICACFEGSYDDADFNGPIRYVVQSDLSAASLPPAATDLVISQAVMEHVDDPSRTYHSLKLALKPGGAMSHTIDFSSHSITRSWNGHWTLPNLLWGLIRGRRPYLINRLPLSFHLRVIQSLQFEVLRCDSVCDSGLDRAHLAADFSHLTDGDLRTRGVYLIARA